MYLRSVRLKGFKSFAKKTELLLEPGVAVVIGPNGSGKSNLAEAVMWALGAQSPTSLRGSSMQDVIFAGSDGRRAAGGAEVELTFDNTDGTLPLPSSEVSVTRRMLRDGQSEYRINHAVCRLTDVVELMSSVGLGKELHSILGQGRVESFLASKPAERRALVEEAAGLGRYKRRRERATIKLRETQRNLERAVDLEREVSAQLAPLRRQASAAEQLRAAERERDELRGRLLAGELAELDGRLGQLAVGLQALTARRAELEDGLEQLARQRLAEEETFARALRERERRAERSLRARALAARLEGCLRLTEQRRLLAEEMNRSAEAERDRLLAELAPRDDEDEGEWAAGQVRLQEELAAAEADHAASAAALAAARRTLAALRAEASAAAAEQEAGRVRAARLEERVGALSQELRTLDQEAAAGARRLEEASAAAAAGSAEAALAAEAYERASRALEEAVESARAAERRRTEAEARRSRAAAEVAAVEAQIEHLAARLNVAEEADAETSLVIDRFPGTAALATGLRCDEGYELALGAALAQHSGSLTVPSGVDGWSLLEELRRAGVRVVRLVLPSRPQAAASVSQLGEPLADHVSGGEHVRRLVASVRVVDDLRAVPASFGGIAVTKDGAFYDVTRGELGLAAGTPPAVLLQQRAQLGSLERQCEGLRRGLSQAEKACAAARGEVEAGERRRAEADRVETEAAAEAQAARRRAETAEGRLREATTAMERGERRRAALGADLREVNEELQDLRSREAERTRAVQRLAEPLAAGEAESAVLEGEHEDVVARLTRLRVELEQRAAARARREREREAAARRAQETRSRLAVLERRLVGLPGASAASAALAGRLATLQARALALAQRLGADGGETGGPDRQGMRRLAGQEAELRRSAEETAERRTELQVAIARLEERRTDVAAAFEAVAARLEVAHFAPPADEAEAQSLGRALERCERRAERIGPVNPLAEAECEELAERAAFLREQRRDLERSLKDLETLIGGLTERVDEGFAATFAVVQENFAAMIGHLFPGGRGALSLVTAENGEDAGVAIDVKPGRKLGKRLSMLSGGERSLTAIAFLMSLMLAHPSPFYILDEIEAALDDVNIGRFVTLLRGYRERTQFIIITHQKRTMEAADILYGVTMGPDAASHVVSARMAEQEIDRETLARKGQ